MANETLPSETVTTSEAATYTLSIPGSQPEMVEIVLRNGYDRPLEIQQPDDYNRDAAVRLPHMYRIRRVSAARLAIWKAEFERFEAVQAELWRAFDDK